MYGVYFDDKIFNSDKFSKEERALRISLQRNITAKEALCELGARGGLYGNKKTEKSVKRA